VSSLGEVRVHMMNVATLEAYLARTSYCMITKSTSMGRKKHTVLELCSQG